jgi:hypothetical protein
MDEPDGGTNVYVSGIRTARQGRGRFPFPSQDLDPLLSEGSGW